MKARAIARPMPREPPVISTFFPEKFMVQTLRIASIDLRLTE